MNGEMKNVQEEVVMANFELPYSKLSEKTCQYHEITASGNHQSAKYSKNASRTEVGLNSCNKPTCTRNVSKFIRNDPYRHLRMTIAV